MSTVNHYGVRVDPERPVTGVINASDPEWFGDGIHDGIDLAWEEHLAECRGQCRHCHCTHTSDYECYQCRTEAEGDYGRHAYDPRRGEHDLCGPQERGTVLAGSWRRVEGPGHPNFSASEWMDRVFEVANHGYVLNETGDYAAIVGEIYAQVIWSKTVVRVRSLCSPCFPGQADVDHDKIVEEGEEGGFLAYDLPASIYGEDHCARCKKI